MSFRMKCPAKNKPETPQISVKCSAVNGHPPDITRQLSSTLSEQSKGRSQTCLQTIFSWRAVMALHMHISLVLLVMLSINMPFALVCMLKAPSSSNSSIAGSEAKSWQGNGSTGFEEPADNLSTTDLEGGEFEWDSTIQGLLLSSSWMLAFILPLMMDFLSRKLGGKRLVFGGMLVIACLTLLQPEGARLSPYLLVALRLGIGLIGAAKFPLISEVFSWWAPSDEKVSMVSFALSGLNIGNVLVSLTSGYLCSIPLDNGWPFIFYVQGSLAVIWCFLWLFTGSQKPEDHPFISEDEKQYIIRTRFAMDKSQKRSSPPYRQIVTSVPVWGVQIIQVVHTYSFLIISSYTPMYLSNFLGFSLEEVGLISSVGYVVRFLGVLGWGFYLMAATLVALGFVREPMVCAVLLCLLLLFQSSSAASSLLMPLDMAPRYAGFLTGFNVTFNTLITMPGPIITATIVQNGTMEEWRSVFVSLAAIVFVGATCFLFMASSELQSWAVPTNEKDNSQMGSHDSKEQKMSVLTEGTPGSPMWNQRRFSFNIESANFNEAELEVNGGTLRSPSLSSAAGYGKGPGACPTVSNNNDITTTNVDNDVTPSNTSEATATATDTATATATAADLAVQDRSSSDANGTYSAVSTGEQSSGSGTQKFRNDTDRGFTNLGFDTKSETRY